MSPCVFSEIALDTGLPISHAGLFFKGLHMLRIKRSANGEVLLTLSGRMSAENIVELETVLKSEAVNRRVVFDLKDLTLVDRDAVRFLSRCEADGIKLKNCPAYIREWIDRGRLAQ